MPYRIISAFVMVALLLHANELVNPGLEANTDGNLPGWESCKADNPYRVVHDAVQEGKCAVFGETTPQNRTFGIKQVIQYDKPNMTPVLFGGWSKCENVTTSHDYCVYLDIFYEDGTPQWAVSAPWSTGTHD